MIKRVESARGLDGRVVLITGASSGIGAATAWELMRRGARLALAARRTVALGELAGRLSSGIQGVPPLVVPLDVTDQEQVEAVLQAVMGRFGRLDVLVNNAGVGELDWLERMDPTQDIERQIDVNLVGVIRMTHAVLPIMQAQRAGHIIQVCSIAGLVAPPTYSVYAATKFGVRGFTEAVRREAAPWGIHVSILYPGAVGTGFAAASVAKRKTGFSTPAAILLTKEQVAKTVARLVERPRRSIVIPSTMRLVAWLAQRWPGLADWATIHFFVRPERSSELETAD